MTSTETVGTIWDGESRTPTLTLTQIMNSDSVLQHNPYIYIFACRRNSADRAGLDKALNGENLE